MPAVVKEDKDKSRPPTGVADVHLLEPSPWSSRVREQKSGAGSRDETYTLVYGMWIF